MNNSNKTFDILMFKCFMFCLVLMPFADFISVYSRYTGIEAGERFSLIYRLFLITIAIYFFLKVNVSFKNSIIFLFLTSILSLTITFFYIDGSDLSRYLETSIMSFKFFVFFVIVSCLKYFVDFSYLSFKKFYNIISSLIFVYAISIILGAFFDIEMFKNYNNDDSQRWGVKGIIIAGNEASGFLTVALAWALLNLKMRASSILLAIVVLASLITGTKAAVLAFIFVISAYILSKYKGKSVLIMLLFLAISYFLLLLIYSNFLVVRDTFDQTMNYFLWHYENSARGDLVNLALTGRDYKLSVVFDEIHHVSPWVYVFGGFPVGTYTVEMDFFDAIALYGFFGALYYFYIWFSFWNISGHSEYKTFCLYFSFSFFLLGFLAGHYFYSAMSAPFLAALCICFSWRNKGVD